MRLLAALAAILLLPGCITMPKGLLTNRVGVTLAKDECRVDSRWLAFGISTPVDEQDCKVIREALLKRLQEAEPKK